METQKILILVGPTASGKSGLAVELARKFNGEVISADSRQVYKGLDRGTGKVTKREMKGVRHHLLDISSPKRTFSAQDFVDRAARAIEEIRSRGKLPIITGGTGFYIDALTRRIVLSDVAPDPKLRERLTSKDTGILYEMLKKNDPERASAMDTPSERNNKVRLIRALEIAAKPAPRGSTSRFNLDGYDWYWIGIAPDMKLLGQKIDVRLHQRLRRGMIAEAENLHARGLSYKRMRELGLEYRSLSRLLQGHITRHEFEAELAAAIRRYAHKQIGYWKRNKDIKWFTDAADKSIEQDVKLWLES